MSKGLFTDSEGNISPEQIFKDGLFVVILMASVVALGHYWNKNRLIISLFSFIVCLLYALIAGIYIYTYRNTINKNVWYYFIMYATIYIVLVFSFLIIYWITTHNSSDKLSEFEKAEVKKKIKEEQQKEKENKQKDDKDNKKDDKKKDDKKDRDKRDDSDKDRRDRR